MGLKVFDLHVDLSSFGLTTGRKDLKRRKQIGNKYFPDQVDFPRLEEGKVSTFLANVCPVLADENGFRLPENSFSETQRQISFYKNQEKLNEDFNLIKSLKTMRKDGLNALISIEGAYFINTTKDLELLPQLQETGVVSIAPTWNVRNNLGTGAYDENSREGLTELGVKFVENCESQKITIDAVHGSRKTFWDIARFSRKPFFVSHTGSYEVFKHQRNLKSDQIREVGKKDGIIGLCFIKGFLGGTTFDIAVKHLKSLVNLAGIDHVSLGGDFDGMSKDDVMDDIRDVSYYPPFIEACIRSGFTEKEMEKITWKNAFNFFN